MPKIDYEPGLTDYGRKVGVVPKACSGCGMPKNFQHKDWCHKGRGLVTELEPAEPSSVPPRGMSIDSEGW